jgi:mono/diheme cytochrome c family protein
MKIFYSHSAPVALWLATVISLASCGADKGSTTLAPIDHGGQPAVVETPAQPVAEDPATSDPVIPTYYGDAKALLDKYCLSCHGSPSSAGAPTEFNLAVYEDIGPFKGAFSMAAKIGGALTADKMPPPSVALQLTDEDKATLLAWVEGNALKGDAPELGEKVFPSLSFINPPDAGTVAGDSLEINVALADARKTTKWSIHFASEKGAVSGGLTIADNIPATQTTYAWDTSVVDPGTYYLYAVVTDGTDQLKFPAKGAVQVTRAPVVTLTSHQGEQIFKNQVGPGNITWTMINANGATFHYTLEFSSDNGTTYLPIPGGEDVNNLFSFSGWNIANTADYPRSSRYKVRVSAIDKSAADPKVVSQSASPKGFGIADQNFTYFGDVYPVLVARGCSGCHGNGQVNVGNFAVSEFDFPPTGAFQMQNRLTADAVLGPSGSMRTKAPAFTNADFDLVKLWKWDGASVGTFDGLKLTSHTGNTVFLKSASPSVITWTYLVPPSGVTLKYNVEASVNGVPVVLPAATNLTNQLYSWDISGLTVDHRYKVKVTALNSVGSVFVGSVESTGNFAIADHEYTYAGDVLPKLTALGCGGCHSLGNASGGFNIQIPATLSSAANLAIRTKPGTGNMPTAGGVSETDWLPIRIWDTSGRKNPTFAFSAPTTNLFKNYGTGANVAASWSATGAVAGIKYDLYYQRRGGSAVSIQTNITATSFSTWNTAGFLATDEGYYRYVLTAKDAAGAVLGQVNSNEFYLSPAGPTYQNGILPLLTSLGCDSCHGGQTYKIATRSTLSSDQALFLRTGPTGTMPQGSTTGIGAANFALINEWKVRGDFITDPTLALTAPTAETFADYGTLGVTWTATGGSSGVTFNVDYKKKGGAYAPLATGIATTSYNWDTSTLAVADEGYYFVRLTAFDAVGRQLAQMASGQFYLSPAGPTYEYGVKPLLLSLGCDGCHGGAGGYTVTNRASLPNDLMLHSKVGSGGNMPSAGGIGAANFKLIDEWKLQGDFVP